MNDQTTKPMSYTEAAIKVLSEYGNKKPMHYQEIVNLAISQGWLATQGLTPGTTLTASIGEDNRRRESRGMTPRFTVEGKGFYGLVAWQKNNSPVDAVLNDNAAYIRGQMLSYLQEKISWRRFEEVMSKLLAEMGFDVQLMKGTKDGGVDIVADLQVQDIGKIKVVVQVKQYKKGNNVGSDVVLKLAGRSEAQYGLIMTTSKFTPAAKEEAGKSLKMKIWLIDGPELTELMLKYKIGVKVHSIYELNEGFFEPPIVGKEASSTELEMLHPVVEHSIASDIAATKNKLLPEGLLLYSKLKDGRVIEATVKKNNHVDYDGAEYKSIHAAGAKAAGWKSCNGWLFWQYQDPETGEWTLLDALRHPNPSEK